MQRLVRLASRSTSYCVVARPLTSSTATVMRTLVVSPLTSTTSASPLLCGLMVRSEQQRRSLHHPAPTFDSRDVVEKRVLSALKRHAKVTIILSYLTYQSINCYDIFNELSHVWYVWVYVAI
jgi:hypothetical protein